MVGIHPTYPERYTMVGIHLPTILPGTQWWVYTSPYHTTPYTPWVHLPHYPAVIIPAGRLHAARGGPPGLNSEETHG